MKKIEVEPSEVYDPRGFTWREVAERCAKDIAELQADNKMLRRIIPGTPCGESDWTRMVDRAEKAEAEIARLKEPDYYWLDGDSGYTTEDIYDIIQDEVCIDAGGEAFIDIAGARSTGTVRYRVTAKEGKYGLDYEYEALAGD